MSEKLPVIAVVPNYNMAESLGRLLTQLAKEDYDAVYVLDDNSTDNSIEVASGFSGVTIVNGESNLGPAGNRNRILPHLGHESILHFLDADVSITSKHNPDKCRKLFENSNNVGLFGGLITMPDGTPWMFNYGPAYSLYSNIGGYLHALTYGGKKPKTHLAKLFNWWIKEFADPTVTPIPREVYWVGEANMIIPSKVFKEVGGFDPALRYHEAQDLAIKLHKIGYRVQFSPEVSVAHPHINALSINVSPKLLRRARNRLIKNYGFHFKNV